MEPLLIFRPDIQRQLLIDLEHRLEYRAAELHPALDHTRPVGADDPTPRIPDEMRRGVGSRGREHERVEAQTDLSVGRAGEGIQRAEVCEVRDGQRGERLEAFEEYDCTYM